MEEFEIKFLEVDVPILEKKLIEIGAKKVGELNYIRTLFDYPDYRLDKNHSWFRLRTDGKETTLTYKERLGIKSNDGSIRDDGMKEIETIVDSYDKTYEILKEVGFIIKHEVKNKRIRDVKGNVVFDIDFYPKIPPYIEIESDSLENAEKGAQELGFNPKDGLVCSANQIYKKYGYNVNDYSHINFEEMVKK